MNSEPAKTRVTRNRFAGLSPAQQQAALGFAELNMRSGANCFACHELAKAAWDLICEQTHGCTPIPPAPVMLRAIQFRLVVVLVLLRCEQRAVLRAVRREAHVRKRGAADKP